MEFEFDKIYDQKVSQSDIFENTKPIITSAVDGYNVCIIAYGQTGSGKSHCINFFSTPPFIFFPTITLEISIQRLDVLNWTLPPPSRVTPSR